MSLLGGLVTWIEKNQYKYGKNRGFIPYSNKNDSKPYPEITGYAAKTFSELYRTTKKNKYKRAAIMACEALVRISKKGLFPQATEGQGSEVVCIFDEGVILNGLLNTYRVFKKEKYLRFSILGLDFLARLFESYGHLPISTDIDGGILNAGTHYYLAKLSEPFMKAYEIIGENKFSKISEENLGVNIKKFFNHGFFYSGIGKLDFVEKENINNSHFMCYAVEGMMTSNSFKKEIMKCSEFLLKKQSNGGISFIYDSKGNFLGNENYIPSLAQCMRIWNFAYKHTKKKVFLDAISKSFDCIERVYDEKKFLPDFEKGGKPCSWSVIFAIDSLLDLKKNENPLGQSGKHI